MNLWIRSQDKESLTKVSNVQYTYVKGDLYTDVRGRHHIGTYYDNLKILGTYETKERALEVLDEIQSILVRINNDNERSKMFGNIGFGTIEPKDVFIQMPKE